MNEQLLTRAIDYASQKHAGQFRKWPENLPYVEHCKNVANELIAAGYKDEVVIAGVLHDTVEDTPTTFEELKKAFGKKVAKLVMSVTEKGDNMTFSERLDAYIKKVQKGGAKAKAISAADKIDNMNSMRGALEDGFDIFEKMWTGPEQQVSKFQKMYDIVQNAISKKLKADYENSLKKLTETITKFHKI